MKLLALSFLLITSTLTAAVRFGTDRPILDLRQHQWDYIPEGSIATPAQAMVATPWKPTRVGQRWDEMGFTELKKGNFWLRLTFAADSGLATRQVGFFATLIDDEADIYLNGDLIKTVKYSLGDLVRGPAIADLTPKLRAGAGNVLLLHLRDTYVRSPGIIGNVCLYQSLPYTRTPEGGIVTSIKDPLSVVLHLGDALLARSDTTRFSSAELRALSVPPYILREDELVLVVPASEVQATRPYKVDLDAVSPTRTAQPLSVSANALPATVGRYELIRLPLQLTATYDNPFDPRQIKVQALVETPSGRIEPASAFFRQEFRQVAPSEDEEILLPVQSTPWLVYYRPRELGVHKIEVIAQDRSGIRKHDAGKFECVPSQSRGFLRVSRRDPSFFEFDNGDSFLAIGPSGWYRGRDYIFGGDTRWVSSRKLAAYYERKAANRSTYEYLGTFHFGPLLLNGGVVDQHIAWKLEYELRTMERLGIRWLFFHDDICRMSRYGFDALPYAASNGGPAQELNQVYFSHDVIEQQKSQLRYLVSRMADSPALWIWNIGDEWARHFGNKFSIPMVRSWITELHATVRELDVYKHPHAIGEGTSSILNGGDVYPMEDWYLRESTSASRAPGKRRDFFEFVPEQTARIGARPFPVINVEGGIYGWNGTLYQSGEPWGYPEAITFHQHLWLGLFLKNAASGTDWMVNVLDRDGQLFHAKALAQYLDGESLTAKPFEQAATPASAPDLSAWALKNSDRTLVWVVNRTWNWLDHSQGKEPQPASAIIRAPVAGPGAYRIEFWNTQSGAIENTRTATATGSSLTVPLPEVTTDLALKLIRQ